MKRRLLFTALIISGIVLMGFVVKGLISSRSNEQVYKFYYYPQLNVYYDFQNKDFVYTIDGGESWLKKEPASSALPERLSEKVLITAATPEVWRDNETHRDRYNGVASDFLKKEIEHDPGFLDKEVANTDSRAVTDSTLKDNPELPETVVKYLTETDSAEIKQKADKETDNKASVPLKVEPKDPNPSELVIE